MNSCIFKTQLFPEDEIKCPEIKTKTCPVLLPVPENIELVIRNNKIEKINPEGKIFLLNYLNARKMDKKS